jgi:hypothetical protein
MIKRDIGSITPCYTPMLKLLTCCRSIKTWQEQIASPVYSLLSDVKQTTCRCPYIQLPRSISIRYSCTNQSSHYQSGSLNNGFPRSLVLPGQCLRRMFSFPGSLKLHVVNVFLSSFIIRYVYKYLNRFVSPLSCFLQRT